MKGAIDLTIRKRLILAMLERRGLIVTNYNGSHESRFDVDYKEPPVESYGDGGVVSYERRDYLQQAEMDWRGYVATDLMTIKERAMTSGQPTTMVNRYKRIFPKLTKGVRNKIGLEFYIDGYAAGNENRFCGVESFCGADTDYDTTGADVADIVADPKDTYLGLSTAVNQSGRWTSDLSTYPNANIAYDWPEGEGSPDFDYWSPKLVNWSSTTFHSDTTWDDTCVPVLRRTLQWLRLTSGADGYTLMAVIAGHMMTDFKAAFDSKLRVIAPHKEAEDLGFPDVLNFEGLGIHTEFGIPANTGYVVNVDEMELDILTPKLINTKGPDYDPDSLAYKFAVYTFGNWRFIPKHCAKLYNYAAS